ncbi:hypothetical protein Tco_1247220 [Tanacetum coccineum]
MNHHRKKGIEVPTEREFRGYYALLKLDKHPGYKVEPSELSLDLAKMTPGIRQATEVLFARKPAELAIRRSSRYGIQKVLKHVEMTSPRTLARCRNFEKSNINCFNERPYHNILCTPVENESVYLISKAESNSSRIRFSMHYQVVLGCSVPWSNERPLENKELNAIIGAWFTLWRD